MKRIIITSLIIGLCICCRNKDTSIEGIDLLSSPESQLTKLSEIAADVEYVPLQTSDSSLLNRISDIKTNGQVIAVRGWQEITCFDRKGHYLFKLNKVGRGPGEYQSIEDFTINSKADILAIKSRENILVYNIVGNEIVFNKLLGIKSDLNMAISDIDFIPGQNNILISYLCNGSEPFRNLLINESGDTINSHHNYYKWVNKLTVGAGPYENISFNYDNSIYFKNWHSDTVFTVDRSDKIVPYLILNARGKQMTPDVLEKYASQDYATLMRSGDPSVPYLVLTKVMEVPRYLIYFYSYKLSFHFEIYDKLSNKKFSASADKFLEDDISGGIDFESRTCFDGKLYSWIDALTLKRYLSTDTFRKSVVEKPERKKALEKLSESLKETDNPVLIIVTPKK